MCSSDLAAPREVYDIITDFEAYHQWNSFTPRITLLNSEFTTGAQFDLDCRMTEATLLVNEHEEILEIRPGEFSFCMGTSRTRGRPGIRSYRWQICEPAGNNETHFINYERFEGPLAPIVLALYSRKLKKAFDSFCLALKKRAESSLD